MIKDAMLIELFPVLVKLVDDAAHAGQDLEALERARMSHNARVWDILNAHALGITPTTRPTEGQ